MGVASWLDAPETQAPPRQRDVEAIAQELESAGSRIGRYRLVQKIGAGGFGVVYLAEQDQPVRRRVALKVIKPGMDTREVIGRFEAERQALALMDHPNIAKVHDAGTTDNGRPYFVMELVQGIPITDYCDQCHLTLRERLELFVTVCQAVQHAHQQGIIHRDLKPSNVLVAMRDGRPSPRIIDFGMAKALSQRLTEHTRITGHAQMVGTPMYMSPEQAELSPLGVDTRSDIYSLGVLLYEMLTSTTPFDVKRLKTATYDELRRIILEEDPQRPSLRISTLHADRAATIAGCRRTDRRRLIQTFRGDLDWIVMKAIEKDRTRRYGTASELAADTTRHLKCEPVEACPPSKAYRFRRFARRNRHRLALAGVSVAALLAVAGSLIWGAHTRAVHRGHLALEVERALGEVQEWEHQQKWEEALSAARRARALLAGIDDRETLSRRVWRITAGLELVAGLEQVRLQIRSGVAGSHFDLAGAAAAYDEAFRDSVFALSSLPDSLREASAQLRIALAALLDDWAMTRKEVSIADWQAPVLAAMAIDPDPWRTLLRQSWTEGRTNELERIAQSVQDTELPPATVNMLTHRLFAQGNELLAFALLREAQRVHPDDFWLNQELGLQLMHAKEPRLAEAVGYFRAALALRPESPGAHLNLGLALELDGRPTEAEGEYREAIRADPQYAAAYNNLGNVLKAREQIEEAVAAYKEAIRFSPEAAYYYDNLGTALGLLGSIEEALAAHHHAIGLEPAHGCIYNNLGHTLERSGDLDAAIEAYRQSILHSPHHTDHFLSLGSALHKKGLWEAAIPAFLEAARIEPTNADIQSSLGRAWEGAGQFTNAIAAYNETIRLDPESESGWVYRGLAFGALGRFEESLADLSKAIELAPDLALCWYDRGISHAMSGEYQKAIADYTKAIELDPGYADAWNNRGMAHKELENYEQAILDFSKRIELAPKYWGGWANRSTVHLSLRQLPEALADSSKAIELRPDFAPLWGNRALVHLAMNQIDKAIRDWQELVRLKPEDINGHSNLAWYLATSADPKLHDGAQAVLHGKRAVELDPSQNNWANLGVAQYRAGNWGEAEKCLQKAQGMSRGRDYFHRFFLAMAHWNLGKYAEAQDEYADTVAWLESSGWSERDEPKADELRRFRAEAERLIAGTDHSSARQAPVDQQ